MQSKATNFVANGRDQARGQRLSPRRARSVQASTPQSGGEGQASIDRTSTRKNTVSSSRAAIEIASEFCNCVGGGRNAGFVRGSGRIADLSDADRAPRAGTGPAAALRAV